MTKIEIDEVDLSEIKKTLEWYRSVDEKSTDSWPRGITIPKASALLKYLEAKYRHGEKSLK